MKNLYKSIRLAEEEFYLNFFENSFNLKVINDLLRFKEAEIPDNSLPFFLRSYSLPIYQSFGGKVHEVCQIVAQKMGFKENEIEFYVSNDADFNASSILSCFEDKPHTVILNRGLLEKIDMNELAFIIGHEIGHIIYRHLYVSEVVQFVFPSYEGLPPFLQKTFDIWSKLGEISSDRIGLLAVGDLEISVRAVFKLSSGLDQRFFNLSYENMIQIADQIFSEMNDHPSYIFATHPSNCVRIKALQAFYNSRMWNSLQKGKPLSKDKDLNEKMKGLLRLLQKVPLDEMESVELQFLATCGIILMKSDENTTQNEYDYLLNVLSLYIQWPPDYLQELEGKDVSRLMKKSAKIICQKFPHKARDVAKKLLPIVIKDGRIHDREVNAFLAITRDELQLPVSEIVDIVLEGIRTIFKPYSL